MNMDCSAETDAGVAYSAPFTISDADAGDVNILTFSPSSTNVNLVPAANITVSGSGTNRTLTIVPAGNLSGETDITVSASDGTKSAEKTFHFIVHKVISMDTNLVENGNATSGLASWSGNTVNITATGDGFSTNDPGSSMSQNIDISKFSTLIDGGETNFLMSAAFPNAYGRVSAQFYTDIACTNPVGSSFQVNGSAVSLQQKIPASAKGVKITFSNTSSNYNSIVVRNISFQIVNDFPKISSVSDKTTNLSALTVPVNAYYTTTSATLTATSSDQTIVPNAGIAVGGSGFNRSVTFTPLKNGVVTITVTLNDGTHTASKSFSVTALEPAVVSGVDLPAAGYYAAGGNLDFTVRFNHNIIGGTGSTLPLTIGGTPAAASYLSATADSITYRYTVGSGDAGAVAVGNAIDDATSPITDTAGYDAETGISAGAMDVTVVQAPVVSSSAAGGNATYGDKITFTATLSCADSLSGTVQFKANGTDLGSPVTISGNAASYETAEKPFDAGSVSVTAEYVPSGADVHFTSLTSGAACTVTVGPKPVSVSGFTADAKVYDGTTAVALSGGTLVGVLSEDDISAVRPSAGTAAEKNAGTRAVTFEPITLDGAGKDNYVLSAQPSVSVEISPKPVTAVVNVSSKAYDGNTDATVTCGFASGDIVAGDAVTVTATGTFDTKDAGTGKAVAISGVTKSGADKDNYNVSVPAGGTADIRPAAITVTPDAVTKVYGQDDPALTYTITSGALIASETLTGSLSRAAGENVNEYEITQDTVTNENNPNYDISFVSGKKLTITRATPEVTVSVDKDTQMTGKDVVVTVTVTYPNKSETDAYPATATFTPVNASAKGEVTVNGNQYSQTFTMGSNLATPATFSATVEANGNYAGASSAAPASVAIIDRYTPSVSVASDKGASATYGDTVTFTATVFDPNGIPRGTAQFYVGGTAYGSEVTLAADGTASISTAAAPLTAGDRAITATYTPAADETDYKTSTSGTCSLTVVRKPVSITGLSAPAREYDGTTTIALTGGAIEGALPGAALSANIPTNGTVPTKTAAEGKPVSFDPIALSGADKDNYELTAQPTVTVNITRKPVTPNVDAANKVYDGTTDAGVLLTFGALFGSDELTATADGDFAGRNVGTGIEVILSNLSTGGLDAGNYDVSLPANPTAQIFARPIQITPVAVSKNYGAADPELTYTITSGTLVASEALTGGLVRGVGEDVNEYEITQGTVTNESNPNYDITFVSGRKLTITRATPEVTVTSNKTGASAVYGDTVTFTATVSKAGSGAVPAGSIQFRLGSVAMGSPVALTSGTASYTTAQTELSQGSKSITAEYIPDTGEINYSANTSAAYDITITKREVTVKADDQTIYVGAVIPAAGTLTYTVTGLIGSDSLVTPPTLSLPADAVNNKEADYTISVTGAEVSGNYTLTMVDGTLRVISAPVPDQTPSNTVIVSATTKAGGDAATSVTTSQISQAATVALRQASQGQGTAAVVEIQVKGAEHTDAVAVTVPKEALDSLTERGLDGLRLNTSVGILTFDGNALSAINRNAEGDIDFKIKTLDPAALSEAVQEVVGDRPVFDFTVTSGNDTISSFDGGNVTVSVSYTLKADEDPNAVVVYYIDDMGNLTPIHGLYNEETGSVDFTVTHFSRYAIGYNKVTFHDVSQGARYYDAVTFCAARGITTGMGNGMFGPDAALTRGQFTVLLMRAYGLAPDENPINNFDDAGATYYTGYLAAAKSLGIANGAGNNRFMPEKSITRQDMFTLLYRALSVLGRLPETAGSNTLSDFSDASEVSDYAQEAMKLFTASGIISVSGGNLDPLVFSTRAQMAQVLYMLLS